jgi:hypothetical protein
VADPARLSAGVTVVDAGEGYVILGEVLVKDLDAGQAGWSSSSPRCRSTCSM